MKDVDSPFDSTDPVCGPAEWNREASWRIGHWAEVDSTNSCAHRALHSAAEASRLHRTVFTADHQTRGRGQHARTWTGESGSDLAMSVLLTDGLPDHHPFSLNLAVSLAVLEGIESALPRGAARGLEVKWPNDIMLKGRKAGGILIENSWRGSRWASAVIGVGLNVFGTAPYPNATNLLTTGEAPNALPRLQSAILNRLDNRLSEMASPEALLRQYHERLLGWGRRQRWQFDGQEIRGVLEGVDLDGRLCVLGEDGMHCHAPGEVGWLGMEPES